MFERISRSWQLVKASANVLRQDKELVVFPLVSVVALMLVVASFAVPVLGFDLLASASSRSLSAPAYVVAFLFYFTQYFVIAYFNTALVGAAMMRLDGGDPTLGDGLRIANKRIVAIAGYALIAATVGMLLRALQQRLGFLGRIVVGLLGAAWSVATFMVVPVLAATEVGPLDAVKESAQLLRKTWGENVVGQAGMGFVFGFIFFAVVGMGTVLVVGAIMAHSVALVVTALVVTMLALAITALVHSALAGIYSAALYRYATKGEGMPGFDGDVLRLAFAPK